jgi:hypothetical protein
MKIVIPLLLLIVTLSSLVLTACKTPKTPNSGVAVLPASCTLLAMSPEDRATHERRLERLIKAASMQKATDDGFIFTVDLRQMPFEDLEPWMTNEQKCCSFLKMTYRVLESGLLEEVTVVCPTEMRSSVMQSFGLRSPERTR